MLALIVSLLLSSISVQASNNYIDKSQLSKGIIRINYNNSKKGAIRVTKDGISYDYILNGNSTIPLQLGNGDYSISVLENTEGNKFKQLIKESVKLNLSNPNDVYLQSIQKINWNVEMDAIKKAKELTKGAKTDKEKVTIIYNYIIENIKYDNDKARKLGSDYLPDIDSTLKSQNGICYDYSSLFASMTRSLGIPTKLVMGRTKNIKEYHAWNQVYLKDTNEWILIDTTYDAAFAKAGITINMIKNEKEYSMEKQY